MLRLDPDEAALTALRTKVPQRIGFGSGHLYANDRRGALAAIQAALDCGVTYFDTARLYGAGRAEDILGEALAGRREDVVLASKAGILPATRSLRKRIVDRLLVLGRTLPAARAFVPSPKPSFPVFGAFDRQVLEQSLETSLRALRTDHLDVFLLHECQLEHVRRDDVRRFAEDVLRKGKVRLVGTATDPATTIAIAEGAPFGSVVQLAGHPWLEQGVTGPGAGELKITHSALGPDLPGFLTRLLGDPALVERFRRRTGVDPADRAAVIALLLQYAMARNPEGFVIFASRNAERVRANVKVMTGSPLDPERAAGLEEVVAACAPAEPVEPS